MTVRTESAAGGAGRWLLLGTALLQAAAPPLIGFAGDATDPPIVPPGPFFAVWGAVVLGCLLAAAWGLPRRRAATTPYRLVQLPLSLVQLGFVGWLLAAGSRPAWLTLPYTLTAAWALTGVTVSAVMAGRPVLAATAVAGLLTVAATALRRRRPVLRPGT
ncbi:hypothetical protein [Dactylosporangium sp. NPDC051541]|uniref:hypothetical protein n=1 Tax=Dactylosporangium sp. NPDC051541 TaxID=3363977 RepID=UPI0037AAF639